MVGNYGLYSPFDELAGSSRSRSMGWIAGRHATWTSGDCGRETSEYLNVAEQWWRDLQPWLERCGYLLRERYREGWVPSWERKGFFSRLRPSEDMVELPVSFGR